MLANLHNQKNFIAIFFILFFCYAIIIFCTPIPTHALSKDAIAIRILSNPEHFSPNDWYKFQKFTGSPQALLVDGYEAVRDGRTIYINAANIVGNTLQTNIYIISYNQEVEQATIDIFGRIIKQWKFNTNINTEGNCIKPDSVSGLVCVLDSECQSGEYCNSDKAKIVRDVKRLSDIANMRQRLEEQKTVNGTYPNLKSGSYLPQITISVWPSWQKVLAQSLEMNLFVDPINNIGDCKDDRFNKITCWDENKKEFASITSPASGVDILPTVTLPIGANVFLYTASPNGSKYRLCANMETAYVNIVGCSGTAIPNRAPEFTSYNFPLNYSQTEYKAYIEAIDPDGDSLTWSFFPLNSLFVVTPVWIGWEAINMPILKAASVYKQKMLYSPKAGDPGKYDFTVVIDDGRGGRTSKNFYLTVSKPKPKISEPLNCTRSVRVNSVYPICTITATHLFDSVIVINVKNLPTGMSIRQISTGLTATAEIYGTPDINSAGSYNIELTAVSADNATSEHVKYGLTVSNYCGDGKTQKPNTEKKGGPKDDGFESCDTIDNIANNAIDSNINKQYGCDASCIYNGGYCGNKNKEAPQEECDDGKNGKNNDTCYDNCKNTFCGDGIIQKPNGNGQSEECDGTKLNEQTCQKFGFKFGTLACTKDNCQYDNNACCNPTDGVWSAWVDGVCKLNSGTYGNGFTTQTRTCSAPVCGGKTCQGANTQSAACCVPATCANFSVTEIKSSYNDGCGGTIECCSGNTWSPLANTVCVGDTFTQTGSCVGTQIGVAGTLSADDGNECTIDTCASGIVSHTNKAENTPCTGGNVCKNGNCVVFCPDTCASLGYVCDYHQICGVKTYCGDCTCPESFYWDKDTANCKTYYTYNLWPNNDEYVCIQRKTNISKHPEHWNCYARGTCWSVDRINRDCYDIYGKY
ncbi:MAG: hypothetical protein US83_C0005G0076 [Candidatus Falkowbacteria bacterium GW2011_GWC2_38_22]|uniref:Uncharacterized protein n=1 Tax=Candidatus Falkowbacteria bacterium GW2011_GWE1_38_31 TaxID=1618638 RepID=A0A0G0JRY3_9BACT|nr:MAG: hypothetical protein US73_C0003G0018 [Candidatus Falkowbacteria bacterium GW2011_GWF2_38_1205]KKQ61563.1 MAG: hypothetical protein US83_C0005G0076 [Candidatus Falkowbacteria bacterium GW2011_GWC2_38_22]KKQ63544.1 MAG: hypothetical protein US84_C0005G0018 [Candidatus Falkowbacteria bacterium GW2011_GWF1_38_22]KKQ65696.1 MAG: hypothetical protein US87_C0005G0018 [Candidatus Falkowbacteria bacterium GW2011_GWE2_38_254]KKQ70313.1 MAG: hypothetical protein US91_C0005G0018 [Candidatus Falkowb